MIFFLFWLTDFTQWTEYFKKELVPSRGRLKVVSPKLKHRLVLGAPLKQSCSGAIEKDLSSTFIELICPSPHTLFTRFSKDKGPCPLIPTLHTPGCLSFQLLKGPQQRPTGSLSPQHLRVPGSIRQPPPSFWATSSAVKGFSQEPWQKKKKKTTKNRWWT